MEAKQNHECYNSKTDYNILDIFALQFRGGIGLKTVHKVLKNKNDGDVNQTNKSCKCQIARLTKNKKALV